MRMGIEMMFDPTTYYHYVIYDFAQSFQEALVLSTDTYVVCIDCVSVPSYCSIQDFKSLRMYNLICFE